MQYLTRISLDPGTMGGKPCIWGKRVTVGMIVGLLLKATLAQGPSRRRYISSDRQSLLESHQRIWWFYDFNNMM
ncbi:MAG: DUF433 domain-containing protein [Desulfosarcina sp.]|nr:DUF433 domain-containing protein [Desulfobacterales bacterium]